VIYHPDLFGGETPILRHINLSPFQQFRIQNDYRKGDKSSNHCGTCRYYTIREVANRYHKCRLMGVTASVATDIRKFGVCDRWLGND